MNKWHSACIAMLSENPSGWGSGRNEPGKLHQMSPRDSGLAFTALLGLSIVVLVVGLLSYAAPDRVAMILTLWALASVPLGIAIGHCTLSEDDATALETPDGVGQTG